MTVTYIDTTGLAKRIVGVLRDVIRVDEIAKLMAAGAAMTRDRAVEYALSIN